MNLNALEGSFLEMEAGSYKYLANQSYYLKQIICSQLLWWLTVCEAAFTYMTQWLEHYPCVKVY